MSDQDEKNEQKMIRFMRRGGFKPKELPKLVQSINAGIRVEKAKDPRAAVDQTKLGKLLRVADACEDLARFMNKKKIYTELRQPAAKMIRAPDLKVGAGAGDYVALAIVTKIFLMKLWKSRKAAVSP